MEQPHPLVDFDRATQKAVWLDLSQANPELALPQWEDMDSLEDFIFKRLERENAVFGYGGYAELREFYARSPLFGADSTQTGTEPRSLHLGMDIWGKQGTQVRVPLNGKVHSTGFNNRLGDYGPTIVLCHEGKQGPFHTLYGHLSLGDIAGLREGDIMTKGQLLGHFGSRQENGQWPPHLHFQVIRDMEGYRGDYPGVCAPCDREFYLKNCPDPGFLTPFG